MKRYTGISLLDWITLLPAAVIAGLLVRNSDYPSWLSLLAFIEGPLVTLFLWRLIVSLNRWTGAMAGRE